MTATYSGHHFSHPQGHVFVEKEGPCTITLQGAASMSQQELDHYGQLLARAIEEDGK